MKIQLPSLSTIGIVTLVLVQLCLIASLPAQSQETTYSFIGRIFNSDFLNTSCPPTCLVAGSFTLPQPLGANIVGNIGGSGDFTPTSFSFSDGVTTLTDANSTNSGFAVDTNAAAGITNFSFYMEATNEGQLFTYFDGPQDTTSEGVNLLSYQAYYFGSAQNNGGGWTSKYQQGASSWGSAQYDDYVGKTMAQKGCATTSLTMEMNITAGGEGAFLNPGALNAAMSNGKGYNKNHNVDWVKTSKIFGFQWVGVNVSTAAGLASALQNSAQAIVVGVPGIKGCTVVGKGVKGHFVLATAATRNQDGSYTISINDPGCAVNRTLDFYPAFRSRGYPANPQNTQSAQQQEHTTDGSALTFSGDDLIELTVIDPQGRRTGFTNQQTDDYGIPESYYYRDSITDADTGDDPTPTTHYLGIGTPASGAYTLLVTGSGEGPYSVDISGYSVDGAAEPTVTVAGTIKTGQVLAYPVTYSSAIGSNVTVGAKVVSNTH